MRHKLFHRLTTTLLTLSLLLTLVPAALAAEDRLTVEGSMLAPPTFSGSTAVRTDGTLWSWECGWETFWNTSSGKPVRIDRETSTATTNYARVDENGGLWVWGFKENFVDGDPHAATDDMTILQSMTKVMDGVQYAGIDEIFSIALKTDGSVWMWGMTGSDSDFRPASQAVREMDGVRQIQNLYLKWYALKTDGTLWRCAPATEPVKLMDGVAAFHASEDESNVLVIRTDGSLWGWGSDSVCQLGRGRAGESTDASGAVKIMDNAVCAYTDGSACFAVTAGGDLYGWGRNQSQELGFEGGDVTCGMARCQSTPKKLMDGVVAIRDGSVLKSDGSLWRNYLETEGFLGSFRKIMDGVKLPGGAPTTQPSTATQPSATTQPSTTNQPSTTTQPSAASKPSTTTQPSTRPAAASAASFTDVKSGDWFHDAVNWAVQNGITTGTSPTAFSPTVTCTNAQILTFLWRAAGEPSPTGSNPFSNVSSSDYYYEAALWAHENGMLEGSSFKANADCTRAMAVTYIWKAKGMPFSSSPAKFSDVSVKDYALSMPVSWAVENGVTTGTGSGKFSPNQTCTRAEIVTFLQRAYGGGAAQTGPYMPSTPSTNTSAQTLTGERGELLRLINAERSRAGLKALETSDALNQAAQLRAADISKGYFDERPDGSSWDSVLSGIAATDAHESMLGGDSEAEGMFAMAMNTEEAYDAIHSDSLTHVGVGYTHAANGYGGYTDFWSLLYITASGSSSAGTPADLPQTTGKPTGSGSFTPVPMKELANLKSLQKKATDSQLAEAYAAALEIVEPLAGLSREDQLQGIASALRARFDSGMQYSMSSDHYNDPYGYFILGSASCAGCTRATGLCLNILGIPYEHINEGEYDHQWCRVNVNGTWWICDAYGLYCGPEPSPRTHPYF